MIYITRGASLLAMTRARLREDYQFVEMRNETVPSSIWWSTSNRIPGHSDILATTGVAAFQNIRVEQCNQFRTPKTEIAVGLITSILAPC